MTTPISWGIVATGGIARQFVEDLRHAPGAQVAAVASRANDTARAFADRHGIPRAYGTWQDLADDDGVDIVYVAGPHPAHFAATELMMSAGKAVLCEKPFTMDATEAAALIDLARERGVFLMEAMWMRTNPAIRAALALVREGAIGEVVAVRADMALVGPYPPEHRLRAPSLGGGALLDLGVYPVTLAHLFLDAPATVAAMGVLTPEGVDETTAVLMRDANGAHAQLPCSIRADMTVSATVSGTTGRIEIPRRFYKPNGFTLRREDAEPEHMDHPMTGNGLHYEAIEAMRCLRDGLTESPLVPLADTLDIMRILDDVRERIGVRY
jgi:predicted dehydrogenase